MADEFIYKFCLYCGKNLSKNKQDVGKNTVAQSVKENGKRLIIKPTYSLQCEYCEKEYKAFTNKNRKYCSRECYIRDRFWRKEDAAEILKNISENRKVEHVPK